MIDHGQWMIGDEVYSISLHVSPDVDLLLHMHHLLHWDVDMVTGGVAADVDVDDRIADLKIDEEGTWQRIAQ